MGDRRFLQDAVPEIEDVRTPGEGVKDSLHRAIAVPRRRRAAPAGSRLPWTGRSSGSSFAAQTGSTVSSRPMRVDAGLARISGELAARALGKADHRHVGMPLACSAATSRAVGAITHRSNCAGDRLPAQLSNNCTASAPASIWPRQIIERDRFDPLDDRGEACPDRHRRSRRASAWSRLPCPATM